MYIYASFCGPQGRIRKLSERRSGLGFAKRIDEGLRMHQQGSALTKCENQPTLVISDTNLTIDELIDVSFFNRLVALSDEPVLESTLAKSVSVVRRALEQEAPVYGVNTNFGGMADRRISPENLSILQHNLIWGLKCG